MKLYFYTTLGCHLCEQAAQLLAVEQHRKPELFVISVDIADDDDLMEQYGVRIPVVKKALASSDLGWPFSSEDLVRYLEQG